MKLPSAYLPVHARKTSNTSLQTNYPPVGRNQVQALVETYDNNSRPTSAQVIDAEFVDFSPPSRTSLNQERNSLDDVLDIDELFATAVPAPSSPLRQVAKKYQQGAQNSPRPPGSQLDIFA